MAQFCAGHSAWALGKPYKDFLKHQLHLIIEKKPKYLWGGAADPEKGLDCSGYLFLACKRAGIPGVTRTTSVRMSMGMGGWTGKDVSLREAADCDIVFWTLREDRPNGHTGIILIGDDAKKRVTHASSKRGVVLDPLSGVLLKDISKIRRLTIGE